MPQSMCDLKAAQKNVEHSLIWKFMFYKFVLSHNAAETTKNICCMKGEGAVDHSTIIRWFMKFCLVARTRMNKQAQVSLRLWILRLCTKLYRQIWQVELREYQVSSASHSPVYFIIFLTSVKHLELLNSASHNQHIAKPLTCPSIFFRVGEHIIFS